MGENGRYGRLRLLCSDFLGETTHLEKVGQDNLDQRIKAGAHRGSELPIQRTRLGCHRRSET